MSDFTIREGVTEPITFQCQQVDPNTLIVSVVDLTSYGAPELHVQNLLTAAIQTFTTAGGKFDFGTRSNGEMIFAPAANDLAAGNYEAFVKVTNGSGKSVNFPSDQSFELRVLKTY